MRVSKVFHLVPRRGDKMERSLRRASALLSSWDFGIDAVMVIPIKLEKARGTAWLVKRGARDPASLRGNKDLGGRELTKFFQFN